MVPYWLALLGAYGAFLLGSIAEGHRHLAMLEQFL